MSSERSSRNIRSGEKKLKSLYNKNRRQFWGIAADFVKGKGKNNSRVVVRPFGMSKRKKALDKRFVSWYDIVTAKSEYFLFVKAYFMRKIVKNILIVIAFLLVIPVSVAITGFCTAPQFSDTYYGELGAMYQKLVHAEGKKIVILGTSSVAFGVDSALIQEELENSGGYTVCNFGLYGALGTKLMLDLSENQIKEGDIVVFAPELSAQTLSLYFSAREVWRAADGNYFLLGGLNGENYAEMAGNFPAFTAEKLEYLKKGGVKAEGVYRRASFDENCDMKCAERKGNVLSGGYDPDNPIVLSGELFSESFLRYLGDYAAAIRQKGAQLYYSFAPMNRLAVADASEETVDAFYEFLSDHLPCKVISDPNNYIMDEEWFYDTNYHLNEAGMTVRSVQLLEDLKNELGIFTPTKTQLPEKPPMLPPDVPDEEGDNTYADYFEYDLRDESWYIVGMSEEGKQLQSVVIPYSYQGKRVSGVAADVFAGNTAIEEIIVQKNIASLRDESFNGCTRLKRIVLRHDAPNELRVGYRLLEGTQANIFVKQSAYAAFQMDYTWGYYGERLVSDES